MSHSAFTLLHFYALRSHICTELYLANGEEAVRLADELRQKTRRSTVGRIALTRTYALEMLANSRLCAAGGCVPERAAARTARECADKAEAIGLDWTGGLAELWRGGADVIAGLDGDARRHFEDAAERFARLDMRLYAAAARCRLGELVGGDAGASMVEESLATLRSESIARPEKVIAMVAPSFRRNA